MSDKASFEVVGPDGHEWKVYADGRIDGFPAGCRVINRIPVQEMLAIERALSCPTSKVSGSVSGDSQSSVS